MARYDIPTKYGHDVDYRALEAELEKMVAAVATGSGVRAVDLALSAALHQAWGMVKLYD